ncbi:MAG: integrase core domain-containing protein [Rhodospirillales bacterium]|nr:integrase core domain-containing protein [Rhodospirillales bacterium]
MQFLIVVLAAWLARQQEAFIEYLKAENRMLKARLGRRRIIFSDAERRLLARRAKAVSRKKLFELDPIVSPDTLLRWHRQLIAMKWTFRRQGPGRPRIMRTIEELVMRMASENPRWGYTRIQGALSNLGHKVARGTVANILKREGIEPAPTRGARTPWSVFLKAHWRSLVAADFLTAEVWKLGGLVTYYILFFLEVPTRTVRIAGITTNPAEAWMLQIARNACDVEDGMLAEGKTLIIDRDAKYSHDWRAFLEEQGVEVIRLPPKSPNLNAHAERFVRTIKGEFLDRMIFIGEASLRRAVREFIVHYHAERNHQGLGNRIIRAEQASAASHALVQRRMRLGGLLSFYHHAAA